MKVHRTVVGCLTSSMIQHQRTARAERQRINFPPTREEYQWESLESEWSCSWIISSGRAHSITSFPPLATPSTKHIWILSGLIDIKPEVNPRKAEDNAKWKLSASRGTTQISRWKQLMKGLHELWQGLKAKHLALGRAETTSKRRSHKKKNQERFFRDPYQFARELFQQSRSGSLSAQKEELETHLKKTYSDPGREISLSEFADLVWPATPPNLNEIRAVVQKARAKSAPGPNG